MADVGSGLIGAAELMARMMAKELFLIENRIVADRDALKPVLEAHLSYMIGLEKSGVLFASGPLCDQAGIMTGDGVTIIRVRSFEEAQAIADSDPFVAAGLRKPTVHRWIVNEGRISVSVDLSDQQGALP